jgi:hypothetical protein
MLKKNPGPERAKLEFREVVLSSFKFLGEFGFRPAQEKETFVRYESSEAFVNVYHGRVSFELGVEIGRLKEPAEKLTLYDIVAGAGAEKTEGFGQHTMFQVSSREGVQQFVPKLACLVRCPLLLLVVGTLHDRGLGGQTNCCPVRHVRQSTVTKSL